ncbi:hypothetical protein F8M41_019497 [Gigaspora margarita]|uniref:Uncharacterized protein n=1 Tax=Gigaspora margarita TaxID=4874 RepID=A0A8H4AJV5_GIGMA|nr:hypothetical protein F8M41_019497 [Gigaspora margarita]
MIFNHQLLLLQQKASQEEIDTHLNSIEEKYATLTSQLPQKRQKIDLQNSSFRGVTKISTTSIEQPPVPSTSQTTDFDSSQYIRNDPLFIASQVYEDSGASVCDNQPSFPDLINVEQTKPDANKKHVTKPLRSTKK